MADNFDHLSPLVTTMGDEIPSKLVHRIGGYSIHQTSYDFYILIDKWGNGCYAIPTYKTLEEAIKAATEWDRQDQLEKAAERKFDCPVDIKGDHGFVKILRRKDLRVLMHIKAPNGTYDDAVRKALKNIQS